MPLKLKILQDLPRSEAPDLEQEKKKKYVRLGRVQDYNALLN